MEKKLEKMISAYNKRAGKWGFNELEIKDGKLVKEFVEQPVFGSFLSKIATLYKNGYMKEDYEKIKKTLEG